MDEIEVRIVELPPMQVAACYGFGSNPENLAWEQTNAFVRENGLNDHGKQPRYFGFNNPNPSTGSPNYGYEQWVTVDTTIKAKEPVKIKQFSGGLYAVMKTRLKTIGEDWHRLFLWRESSPYRPANHQWLEECLTPPTSESDITMEMELDLYIPISE